MSGEAQRKKALQKCDSHSEIDITGCSIKVNPLHNKTSFKLGYNEEELS
jgi:hypothetical protein